MIEKENIVRKEITLQSVIIDDSRISEYDIKLSDVGKTKPKLDEERTTEEARIFRERSIIRKSKQESFCYRYCCCNGYFELFSNEIFNDYFWYCYFYCFYMSNIKYDDNM